MSRCEYWVDGRPCALEPDHPGNCVPRDNEAARYKPVEEVYDELYPSSHTRAGELEAVFEFMREHEEGGDVPEGT